jgi:hypothetical protein
MRGLDPPIQHEASVGRRDRRRLDARINPRIKSGDGRDGCSAYATTVRPGMSGPSGTIPLGLSDLIE